MSLEKAAETLRRGGVALLPTDTVYGLVASPQSPAALARIFALKARPAEKNLPILVADQAQFGQLGVIMDARITSLVQSPYLPGALTLVLALDPAKAPPWLAGRHIFTGATAKNRPAIGNQCQYQRRNTATHHSRDTAATRRRARLRVG